MRTLELFTLMSFWLGGCGCWGKLMMFCCGAGVVGRRLLMVDEAVTWVLLFAMMFIALD